MLLCPCQLVAVVEIAYARRLRREVKGLFILDPATLVLRLRDAECLYAFRSICEACVSDLVVDSGIREAVS
jgi:hypothetical protein